MSHNAAPPRRRRVVYAADSKSQGRSGCIITGAVLGIIVGATFAFYGLPPILRHYYGEKHIAVGEQYSGDHTTISVVRIETAPDPESGASVGPDSRWFVTLVVTTTKSWTPSPGFKLQFEGVDEWVQGSGAAVDRSDHSSATAAQEVHVFFQFPAPASRADARPLYLHLSDPRVRFTLP